MNRTPAALALTAAALSLAPTARAQEDRARREGFRLNPTGYAQGDLRAYTGWTVAGGEPGLRSPGSEWRRLRLGVSGRLEPVRFEVDVAPALDRSEGIKDAWVGVRVSRALEVRVGRQKVPVSPERLTSSSRTDFIERAAVVEALAPDRDWGIQVLGERGRFEYRAGAFRGDGGDDARSGTTLAGRLAAAPWRWLTVGASLSRGRVTAGPTGAGQDASPNGLGARGATGYLLFEPVFVHGRRLRFGADLGVRAGAVSLRGEYLDGREERLGQGPLGEHLPELRGSGFSASATWLITGERKTNRIRPRRRLLAGPGAVELALRYEELRMDDVADQGFESFVDRAPNVRDAALRAVTGGVNWWPTAFLRLAGNVLVEEYEDVLRAPEPGRRRYVSLLARLQVQVP